MDKEAQKKIIQILNEPLKAPWAGNATDTIQAGVEYQSLEILKCLKELGYRKLPKDKPPDDDVVDDGFSTSCSAWCPECGIALMIMGRKGD